MFKMVMRNQFYMGYNVKKFIGVRERFKSSHPENRTNLLHFILVQATEQSNFKIQKVVSEFLNTKTNFVDKNLDLILVFAQKSIDLLRTSDRADRIVGKISIDEFYKREERYTDLEMYLFKLIHNI